jgi:hypothetical protein
VVVVPATSACQYSVVLVGIGYARCQTQTAVLEAVVTAVSLASPERQAFSFLIRRGGCRMSVSDRSNSGSQTILWYNCTYQRDGTCTYSGMTYE